MRKCCQLPDRNREKAVPGEFCDLQGVYTGYIRNAGRPPLKFQRPRPRPPPAPKSVSNRPVIAAGGGSPRPKQQTRAQGVGISTRFFKAPKCQPGRRVDIWVAGPRDTQAGQKILTKEFRSFHLIPAGAARKRYPESRRATQKHDKLHIVWKYLDKIEECKPNSDNFRSKSECAVRSSKACLNKRK